MNTTTAQHPIPQEVTQAQRVAAQSLASARGMVIDSGVAYQAAGDELADLRARWKRVDDARKHLKEPHLEGCRRVDEFFRQPLADLESAAGEVKDRMLVFQRAEDARLERERREQEARERAEREALEAQQREAQRREQEARERAEREAREADAAAAAAVAAGDEAAAAQHEREAQEARERAEREALEAQQAAEDAQAAIELAAVAPPAPVVQSAARASGIATRKTWKVKAIDKRALVLAVAEAVNAGDQDKADQLLAYLSADESALNRVAAALKGHARVPGVTFQEVSSIAPTGRRGG